MKERFQNWITTVCGLAVLVFGGVAVWFGKVPWYALGAFLILAYVLIRSKDPAWAKAIIKGMVNKFSTETPDVIQDNDKG